MLFHIVVHLVDDETYNKLILLLLLLPTDDSLVKPTMVIQDGEQAAVIQVHVLLLQLSLPGQFVLEVHNLVLVLNKQDDMLPPVHHSVQSQVLIINHVVIMVSVTIILNSLVLVVTQHPM